MVCWISEGSELSLDTTSIPPAVGAPRGVEVAWNAVAGPKPSLTNESRDRLGFLGTGSGDDTGAESSASRLGDFGFGGDRSGVAYPSVSSPTSFVSRAPGAGDSRPMTCGGEDWALGPGVTW